MKSYLVFGLKHSSHCKYIVILKNLFIGTSLIIKIKASFLVKTKNFLLSYSGVAMIENYQCKFDLSIKEMDYRNQPYFQERKKCFVGLTKQCISIMLISKQFVCVPCLTICRCFPTDSEINTKPNQTKANKNKINPIALIIQNYYFKIIFCSQQQFR